MNYSICRLALFRPSDRYIFVVCTHSVMVSLTQAVSIRSISHDIRRLASFRLPKVPFLG